LIGTSFAFPFLFMVQVDRKEGEQQVVEQLSVVGEILLLATRRGNVVIAGHGAEFLLPNETGFSVLLTQLFDDRVRNTRFNRHCSLETAKELVEISNEERAECVSHNLSPKSEHPHVYDLVINVERLGIAETSSLIVAAARVWISSVHRDEQAEHPHIASEQ
jgi:cytidylate kinase